MFRPAGANWSGTESSVQAHQFLKWFQKRFRPNPASPLGWGGLGASSLLSILWGGIYLFLYPPMPQPPVSPSVGASHWRFLGRSGCVFRGIAFQLRFLIYVWSIVGANTDLKSIRNQQKTSTMQVSFRLCFSLLFGWLVCRTLEPPQSLETASVCSAFSTFNSLQVMIMFLPICLSLCLCAGFKKL